LVVFREFNYGPRRSFTFFKVDVIHFVPYRVHIVKKFIFSYEQFERAI
jgi:hypothetical protein